ncbi:uncharacterized protein [Periplaneta americana]|uniref:uncharacterized protein isoform X2 n=1 Tax=Periplaneta americana TaxID=6978 RepID=UPI0037E8B794
MWRQSTFVIPITALLALVSGPSVVSCSRDGFNMYKDLLLRGKVDGVDDAEEQMGPGGVPNIPKLYFYRTPLLAPHNDGLDYMISRDNLDESLEAVDSEQSNEGAPKSGVLRDRFPLPRTIVKRDTGRRYTYTGASQKTVGDPDMIGLNKRGPGSILTWALSSKRPLQSDMSFFFSLFRKSRHPGVGGPTSFIATMGKRNNRLE